MPHLCRSAISYGTGAAIGVSPQQYLGKYKLLTCLGKGGMAEVWKPLDPVLMRFVAIKILDPDLQENPEFLARFQQEWRIVASLKHPNIVKIHGFEVVTDPASNSSIAPVLPDYIEEPSMTEYMI